MVDVAPLCCDNPACSPASQVQLSGWSIPSVPGALVVFTTVTFKSILYLDNGL